MLLLGNEQHAAQNLGLLGAECLGEGNRSFEWHKMISHAYNRINKTDNKKHHSKNCNKSPLSR